MGFTPTIAAAVAAAGSSSSSSRFWLRDYSDEASSSDKPLEQPTALGSEAAAAPAADGADTAAVAAEDGHAAVAAEERPPVHEALIGVCLENA